MANDIHAFFLVEFINTKTCRIIREINFDLTMLAWMLVASEEATAGSVIPKHDLLGIERSKSWQLNCSDYYNMYVCSSLFTNTSPIIARRHIVNAMEAYHDDDYDYDDNDNDNEDNDDDDKGLGSGIDHRFQSRGERIIRYSNIIRIVETEY